LLARALLDQYLAVAASIPCCSERVLRRGARPPARRVSRPQILPAPLDARSRPRQISRGTSQTRL
jgi:hypothetical protein